MARSPFLLRRRFVAALGAALASAGCTDLQATVGGGGDSRYLDGTTVDYPGFLPGGADAASVSRPEGGVAVEYADPAQTFGLVGAYEGETDTDRLTVTRSLGGDGMRAFVAPVHDGGWTYHVFANEAFVEHATWHVVLKGKRTSSEADFGHLGDGVHHVSVSPPDGGLLAVVDRSVEALGEGDWEATGVDVLGRAPGSFPDRPEVSFTLERDRSADTVTVEHAGGDALDGSNVVVEVGDERYPDAFGSETVTAGDAATVEVADATARVRVLYVANGSETTVAYWR